uniref:Uncharacterized protein n=1 Tax=Triticum urartu TaxID=4572 RepID=A0A8R7NXM5_TRIUA
MCLSYETVYAYGCSSLFLYTAYGFFVDHTYKGNQVGFDAPFIRNVDENYPSSPGMRLCGYSNHNFQWHRHVLINKMGSSE